MVSHFLEKYIRTSVLILCILLVVMGLYQGNYRVPPSNPFKLLQQSDSVIRQLEKIPEHHTELETHRYQMALSTASDFEELHKLMARQYDVKHGLYEGKPYKKILYWNNAATLPVGRINANFGVGVGRDQYKIAGCPVWQCETSQNNHTFPETNNNTLEYDAVIFNGPTGKGTWIPSSRSPHQRYILFGYEAANRYFGEADLDYPAGFFNWTMTYRWDSDVVHPYGWIEPLDIDSVPMHPNTEVYQKSMDSFRDTLLQNNINNAAGKTKMVVSFISNCHTPSRRERVLDLISKSGVPVDNYGSCGNNLTCGNPADYGRPKQVEEACLANLTKNYKFFLAFHNSLCQDYIAERFFNALRYPIVPIVIDAHGHHAKMAPPHSFINVLDFPSIPALAQYLTILDKNDTLYNEYFWWRGHYKVRNGQLYEGMHYKNYCSLCAALHNPSLHSNQKNNSKSYSDIKDWWETKGNCKNIFVDGLFTMNDPTLY